MNSNRPDGVLGGVSAQLQDQKLILVKNPPFSPRVSGGVGGYLSLGEVEIKETE
jgi:hypothetical protein